MKKALLVGINYVGTTYELRGCINDVINLKTLLNVHYGFEDSNITTLLEASATTENIKKELSKLVLGAKPGDVIVFHYSGHGSQLPSTLEADKWEEIICPIDLNWRDKVITDKDFKEIFDKVPNGVNTTVFLDCCHSGDALNQAESFNPLAKVIDAGKAIVQVIQTGLLDSETRSRFLPPPSDIAQTISRNEMEIYEYSTSRDVNVGAMLIAACAPHQTSADALIDGVYQGAGTNSLVSYLKTNTTSNYFDLITAMNNFMIAKKYTQRPQLDGSFRLHVEKVFEPWSFAATVAVPTTNVTPSTPINGSVDVVLPKPKKKKKKNIELIIAAAVILLIVLFAISK